MEIEILVNNGFVFYSDEDGKFIVEKRPSKTNNIKIDPLTFEEFKEAKNYIESILEKPNTWQAIIRFNRGLGIEYKNIQPITAESREAAKKLAFSEAEKLLGDSIIEIKVNPISRKQ